MDRSVARLRYNQHKGNAKKRGIEFEFTFEEWVEIWEPHWADRGGHSGGKVMCRTHDTGPYAPKNVRIDTPRGNAAEAGMMRRSARPQWKRSQDHGGEIKTGPIWKSHASRFLSPDRALEFKEHEYEWIPE